MRKGVLTDGNEAGRCGVFGQSGGCWTDGEQARRDGAWRRARREWSGWEWRRESGGEASESEQDMGSGGIVTEQLDVELAAVAGELGGQAEEPKPEAVGLGRAPGSGEGRGPDRVQELVGDGPQDPEESIAVEVIDGGGPCSELAEFLDPLFDDSTPVVAAPGGEGVDAFDVGEQVSAHENLVGVELEGVVVACERMACLEREKTDAPHTAGGGPELTAGEDVLPLARAAPGLLMVRKPLVGRDLEQKRS